MPSMWSSQVRRRGECRPASETVRQNRAHSSRAPSSPSAYMPCAATTAFMVPAEVPEIASIQILPSSNIRSSTPQVKAPCAPPPLTEQLATYRLRLADGWVELDPRPNRARIYVAPLPA